jgi:hypothetical protein
MSSSRDHWTFTGARPPSALATATDSMMTSESGVARRPKPPPVFSTCRVTLSGVMPAVCAATA